MTFEEYKQTIYTLKNIIDERHDEIDCNEYPGEVNLERLDVREFDRLGSLLMLDAFPVPTDHVAYNPLLPYAIALLNQEAE